MRATALLVSIWLAASAPAQEGGGRVQYVGGTVAALADAPKGRLLTTDSDFLIFQTGQRRYAVRWSRITLLEYGQRVNRRYAMGVIISPLLVLSKSRKHFLTIGFTDEEGAQQAMVFRVDKDDIRSLLVSLEVRTNLKVEYQDEDARKAGKG
jgi:hypothetical protein